MCLLARWPIASNGFDTEPPPATSSSGGHLSAAEEENNDETMRYWSTGLPPSSPPPPTSPVSNLRRTTRIWMTLGMLCLIWTVSFEQDTVDQQQELQSLSGVSDYMNSDIPFDHGHVQRY
jgi:hypothetical protein